MKIVALIPARGGSKSIPYKNIKIIGFKPLVYWSCIAAVQSKNVDEVYVSTEDPLIKFVVESLNLGVKVIDRPLEYASDTASTESVMIDFMDKVDFDILLTIQATSPMTITEDLDKAIELFKSQNYDSLLTGVNTKRFFWTKDGKSLNYDFLKRPRRQDFDGTIMENGAFYLTKKEILLEYKNRLGGKIGVYEMIQDTAVEIDEPEDWEIVDKLLKKRVSKDKLKQIKIIITDFDGVWTDNKVLTDDNGVESVLCSKEDSLGLDYFRERSSIPIMVVSRERNKNVNERCRKLKLPVLLSIRDKEKAVGDELQKRGLKWEDLCFIGNDLNDLEVIKKSGMSFCPIDAVSEVKDSCDITLQRRGGDGAIREVLNLFND